MRSLSQLLTQQITLLETRKHVSEKISQRISLGDILDMFHERGFGLPLFILSLPMALPIPVPPGINVILALPLLLLTFQQILAREHIWLPTRLQDKSISASKFSSILTKSIPFVSKIEILLRPRLQFITSGLCSRFIGLAGFIMALAICVPIPLSNTVPSFGIALMALGVLTRDGVAVLTGMIVGVLWVVILTYILLFLGEHGFEAFKDLIKSVL